MALPDLGSHGSVKLTCEQPSVAESKCIRLPNHARTTILWGVISVFRINVK